MQPKKKKKKGVRIEGPCPWVLWRVEQSHPGPEAQGTVGPWERVGPGLFPERKLGG